MLECYLKKEDDGNTEGKPEEKPDIKPGDNINTDGNGSSTVITGGSIGGNVTTGGSITGGNGSIEDSGNENTGNGNIGGSLKPGGAVGGSSSTGGNNSGTGISSGGTGISNVGNGSAITGGNISQGGSSGAGNSTVANNSGSHNIGKDNTSTNTSSGSISAIGSNGGGFNNIITDAGGNKVNKKTSAGNKKVIYPKTGKKYTRAGIIYKILKSSSKVKTVKVIKAKKSIIKAKIPASIKIKGYKYKVVSIAKNAFAKCYKLKKAIIGKNIKSIGKKAFYKSRGLSNIKIKSTKLKRIGRSAFKSIKPGCIVKIAGNRKYARKVFAMISTKN